MTARVLCLDIETAPLKGYFWRLWKENIGINQLLEEWSILTWSAKFIDEDETYYDSVHLHSKEFDPSDDKVLLNNLWPLLDESDVVVAHNGNRFDIPKINTRFLKAGLPPPSPYKKVDTFQIAKKQFAFTSNRLDHLAKFLGIGEKASTGGFDLWMRCMEGDREAFDKMLDYNVQDVYLLEQVYLALRPWDTSHPNLGVYEDSDKPVCPKCGSHHLQSRGYYYTQVGKYRRLQFQDCGGWSRTRFTENTPEVRKALVTNAV